MSDMHDRVNTLRRPRLLLRAVQCGLPEYRRDRTLRQLLRLPVAPPPGRAAAILLEAENDLDRARREADASYSPARHVAVLIALVAETRLMSSEAARGDRLAAPAPALRAVGAR